MAWKNTGFSPGEPNSYLLTRIITLFVQVRRWPAPLRPGRPEGTKRSFSATIWHQRLGNRLHGHRRCRGLISFAQVCGWFYSYAV